MIAKLIRYQSAHIAIAICEGREITVQIPVNVLHPDVGDQFTVKPHTDQSLAAQGYFLPCGKGAPKQIGDSVPRRGSLLKW